MCTIVLEVLQIPTKNTFKNTDEINCIQGPGLYNILEHNINNYN